MEKNNSNTKYDRLMSFIKGDKDINYEKIIDDIKENEGWEEFINSIRELQDVDFEYKLIWNKIKAKIDENDKNKAKNRIFNILSRCAVIIIFFIITLFLYVKLDSSNEVNNNLGYENNKKAFIELYNGKKIELSNKTEETVLDIKNIQTKINLSKNIQLKNDSTTSMLSLYNRIIIPRSVQHKVKLEDGSIVWLNSESELRYPVSFSKKERIVYLKGEGYFEIATDTKRPFSVVIDSIQIKVLGTSFNVNGYKDLSCITTTLMSGSIKIINGDNIVNLSPNQQAKYDSKGLEVKQVNADDYAMWTDGIFRFNNMPLYLIMKQVERWYDVNVYFEDINISNHLFSGSINKRYSIKEIFKLIEKSAKIKFNIESKNIRVKYK